MNLAEFMHELAQFSEPSSIEVRSCDLFLRPIVKVFVIEHTMIGGKDCGRSVCFTPDASGPLPGTDGPKSGG
jgi:hypothetical protein